MFNPNDAEFYMYAPLDGELLKDVRDGRQLISLIMRAQMQKTGPRWTFYPKPLTLRFVGGIAWTATDDVVVLVGSDSSMVRIFERKNEDHYVVLRKIPHETEGIYVLHDQSCCLRVVA